MPLVDLEARKAYIAKYRAEHIEEIRAYDRARRPRKLPKPRQTLEEKQAYHKAYGAKKTAEGFWKRFYRDHPERKGMGRSLKLVKQYGITVDDYERIYDGQQGLCAICGQAETDKYPSGAIKRLSVDHDHETQRVRGLLCRSCNVGIGNLGDDVERVFAAAVYLDYHRSLGAVQG